MSQATRIPPSVLFSQAGLKYDNTRSGRQESRKESFTEAIIPLWDVVSETLTEELLPEWDIPGEFEVWFDYGGVEELTADATDRFERYGKAFERGGISLNEYREGLGYDRVEETDADAVPSPHREKVPDGPEVDDRDRERPPDRPTAD